MTVVLENHIIFMVFESFLGPVPLPLLAGCFHFGVIFTGCAASTQSPIACVCLEEATGATFTSSALLCHILSVAAQRLPGAYR